jgi:signal transduction histidine kinase
MNGPEDQKRLLLFKRFLRMVLLQRGSSPPSLVSLAQMIAQAHHGEIMVESELTKGSCVSIWLPLAQA